ncbi:hypothetical protein ACQJBY_038520 [Aegilops geniculata]
MRSATRRPALTAALSHTSSSLPPFLPRGNPSRRPLPLVLLPAPLPGGAPDRRATSSPPHRRTQVAAPSRIPVAPPLEPPLRSASPSHLPCCPSPNGGGSLHWGGLRRSYLPRRRFPVELACHVVGGGKRPGAWRQRAELSCGDELCYCLGYNLVGELVLSSAALFFLLVCSYVHFPWTTEFIKRLWSTNMQLHLL